MKTFSGFPSGKVQVVGIPRSVFTELIPLIDDLAELKLTLHALWRLRQQSGRMRYLRFEDLASDKVLLSSLAQTSTGRRPTSILRSALSQAVERGTLLRVDPPKRAETGYLYFANTPKGRAAVRAISQGAWPEEIETPGRPNIFTLYEQNIGMLTPLIAEELREAEQVYPISWIEEAFREAVGLNKRSWRYIQAILERWSTEGKDEKREKRSAEADRRRYLEWKHGQT
jgi:DnaD/phage-associated family protein